MVIEAVDRIAVAIAVAVAVAVAITYDGGRSDKLVPSLALFFRAAHSLTQATASPTSYPAIPSAYLSRNWASQQLIAPSCD